MTILSVLKRLAICLPLVFGSGPLFGQMLESRYWAGRPMAKDRWPEPNRPIIRMAELRARHGHGARWREVVFSDPHLRGEYVSAPAGERVATRFHPDTRIYWVVFEGRIQFEIEGQKRFTASKGSMVQVPKQTLYSFETIGDAPSLRLEVTIPGASAIYPGDSKPAPLTGVEWLAVRAPARKPEPFEHGNQPHINLYDLTKDPTYGDTFFVDHDNAIAHIVCAYAKDKPAIVPGDRGHYHAEGAEVFINLMGQNRIIFEGPGAVTASGQGDILYVPRYAFHNPRPEGPERSCRLVLSAYREPLLQLRDK